MKFVAAALCLALSVLPAAAASPSTESLDRLLHVMSLEKNYASMRQHSEAMMRAAMEQQMARRPLSEQQRALAERIAASMIGVMNDELSWARMRPMLISVYTEVFTQEEIDGLVAFYEGPVGRAFIAKTPLAMQRSMAIVQERMGSVMQRMEAELREALEGK